jgi:dolichol-phosphate mannosyltransferase
MAVDALCAHSIVPLRLATYAGLLVAFAALLLSAGYLFSRVFATTPWPAGFATTTVLILFGISLNAIFLGIIGEYVGRIYNQVRLRPTIVIERAVNIASFQSLNDAGSYVHREQSAPARAFAGQ